MHDLPVQKDFEVETALRHQHAVEQVIALMREPEGAALNLEAMAEIARLSPYHFARVFRRTTGIPPGEFSTALRMERAKRLLLTTDLSASEVCFEVGYNGLGTFTARFARLVGLPPGRLRRLPERLHAAFDRIEAGGEDPPPVPPIPDGVAGVAFRVRGRDLGGSRIFAGLFPVAIPQGRPAQGIVLSAPGSHRLSAVLPDGIYHLMAATVPRSGDPLKLLLPAEAMRVGRSRYPVVLRSGRSEGCADVTLRQMRPTDPPVLVALPALLLERLGAG